LRQIDRRVRHLSKCIETYQVVEYSPQQEGKVYFGANVEVENEAGETLSFRIVGPEEIYEGSTNISIDSPMARALLGKQVDEDVIVNTPEGKKEWWINTIHYQTD